MPERRLSQDRADEMVREDVQRAVRQEQEHLAALDGRSVRAKRARGLRALHDVVPPTVHLLSVVARIRRVPRVPRRRHRNCARASP
jgi:hypothetical protein